MIDLLAYCLEDYVELVDPRLEKLVEEARQAGREDAVCSVCPPEEISSALSEFFGWFMVRKVSAGQGLMRTAGTVVRRLGRWLYEPNYIDAREAGYFYEAVGGPGRALPKATALRDRLTEWVGGQPPIRLEKTYEDHFRIVAVTKRGWQIEGGPPTDLKGVVPLPSHLVDPQQTDWEVSGVIAETPHGLRWVEVWNVYWKSDPCSFLVLVG